MTFASALSEHPVASHATGEVLGAVLEAVGDRPDLVVVSATRPHAGALEDIVRTVSTLLHPLAIVGAAAESVIGTGREIGETPAISLWAGRVGPLAQVALTATRLADDSWHFAGWPDRLAFEPTALLLLADPFTFPAGEFLSWLEGLRPGLPVVGGNVSGGRGPGGSRLVVGDRVVSSGATGVLLGSGVDVETVVSQGCRAYGSSLTVTRSDRNVIYELAGAPALSCLVQQIQSGLGAEDVAGLGANGLLVGRLIDERVDRPGAGDFLVRTVVGVDRSSGAVAVDGQVPLGSTVRFHVRDATTASEELHLLLHGRRAAAAMMFTCNGRGTRLFDDAHHDARELQRTIGPAAVGGFSAAGEFGPVGGRNFVHNSAASLVLLRER
ncbi:MAG: FIST N-terminal domain-containing protein [Acidimicrobiales bacterium]